MYLHFSSEFYFICNFCICACKIWFGLSKVDAAFFFISCLVFLTCIPVSSAIWECSLISSGCSWFLVVLNVALHFKSSRLTQRHTILSVIHSVFLISKCVVTWCFEYIFDFRHNCIDNLYLVVSYHSTYTEFHSLYSESGFQIIKVFFCFLPNVYV